MNEERTHEPVIEGQAHGHESTSPAGLGRGRISGIDLARALAILGMLAVHVSPPSGDTLADTLYNLPHGRASILFVLVAGVGVSMLASSRSATLTGARLRLGWRALVLLPVGLALQELDHRVLVILQDYAVLFLVGILAIGLSNRAVLALAALIAVIGPVGFLAGEVLEPATFDRSAVAITDPVGEIAHGLVLSGPYPLITWAAPFLLGIWFGRQDLRAGRVRWALAAAGAVLVASALLAAHVLQDALGEPVGRVDWDHIIADSPHSQMPLWLVGSTGAAMLVLGLTLVVADALGKLAWPLVATGQLALTVYIGHLFALHWWSSLLRRDTVSEAVLVVLAFMAVAALFSVAWRALFPRGPLEGALNLPWSGTAWLKDRLRNWRR